MLHKLTRLRVAERFLAKRLIVYESLDFGPEGFVGDNMIETSSAHRTPAPSLWVKRWLGLLRPGGHVLDVACGFGRHTRVAVESGHRVTAIDRSGEALATLAGLRGVRTIEADIEGGAWPLIDADFDAVIVTNYLHRPLFPDLLQSVSPSGLLIYETFAEGNERFGRPANPEFLLKHGELLELVAPSLRVLAYEDIYSDDPKPAMVQRICAAGPAFIWNSVKFGG